MTHFENISMRPIERVGATYLVHFCSRLEAMVPFQNVNDFLERFPLLDVELGN